MSSVILISRRGFLKTTFSAGALILCAKVLPGEPLEALSAERIGIPAFIWGLSGPAR